MAQLQVTETHWLEDSFMLPGGARALGSTASQVLSPGFFRNLREHFVPVSFCGWTSRLADILRCSGRSSGVVALAAALQENQFVQAICH